MFDLCPTRSHTSRLHGLTVMLSLAWLLLATACQPTVRPTLPVQPIDNPAQAGARLPRLTPMPDGGTLMSWVEPWSNGHILKFAVRNDGRWIRQGEIALGDNWFINWADFPSVRVINPKFWVAHWLVNYPGGGTYEYDIAIAISTDAGVTWSDPKRPHRDGIAAEHGFATIFPVDEEAGVIWLDGRDYSSKKNGHHSPATSGNFSLRYSRMDRHGNFGPEQIIDDNTCTCCGTSVANTTTGPIAAWRSRTHKEVRDNFTARLQAGRWSAPQPLGDDGWEIPGCPVNGPMLAAQGMNVIGAWYTEEGDHPRVKAAVSNDGGRSFTSPIIVDEHDPFGRIGVVWHTHQSAVITWITAPDDATNTPSLALRVLSTDGTIGPIHYLTKVSGGRDSGFPQFSAEPSGFLLAWTGAAPEYGIHTAWIPTETLAR
ncbi:MAG: hypothetical protein KC594_00660 [Nitrospira sp.]|nr:hypothetical protein [Nitrospira sp.]